LEPAAMANQFVFWTYQDENRQAVDNFEQTPLNAGQNTLMGSVTAPGFSTFEERLLNFNATDYPPGFSTDSQFFHDTLGLKLAWSTPQTYTTNIPGGANVTSFTHLTFRVAKKVTGAPVAGPPVNLLVNIQDGSGNTGLWNVRTDQFDTIPHPYVRTGGNCGTSCNNQAQMVGVRIPLRNFTMNNSGVDLTNIVRITIITEGAGEIGIDDIEFGK